MTKFWMQQLDSRNARTSESSNFLPLTFCDICLFVVEVSNNEILAFVTSNSFFFIFDNTLTSGFIQAVRKKTTGSHLTLRGKISAPVRVTDLVEMSKDAASLVVCTQKNFFGWGVLWVFCEWRHKWRTSRPPWPTLLGPGHQPLGGSISLKFLLETRQHLSLLILWMTCWDFRCKSYDVS